jgi:hypothetical protein
MRYALFDIKTEADDFAKCVQTACNAAQEPSKPKIIICPFPALGRWAVSMPVEPAILRGEIVDTVEPPVSEEE